MENFADFVKILKQLNPQAKFIAYDLSENYIIFSLITADKLKLPSAEYKVAEDEIMVGNKVIAKVQKYTDITNSECEEVGNSTNTIGDFGD